MTKAIVPPANRLKNPPFSKTLKFGKQAAKAITANKKTAYIEIPPKDGLDSFDQRIVTSFLLRIPRLRENLRRTLFIVREAKMPAIKNPININTNSLKSLKNVL